MSNGDNVTGLPHANGIGVAFFVQTMKYGLTTAYYCGKESFMV